MRAAKRGCVSSVPKCFRVRHQQTGRDETMGVAVPRHADPPSACLLFDTNTWGDDGGVSPRFLRRLSFRQKCEASLLRSHRLNNAHEAAATAVSHWVETNRYRRMASSGMLRRVALVRSDVSEELSASIIRVTRIGELVPSSQILVTLMEALSSSESSVLTRATRPSISEDAILHSHRRENLKSYKSMFT
jgi:hypothetical protein